MTKLALNAYRGYTAAAIKSRADVPTQASMTVVGTTVECENIDTDQIASVLGIAVNDFEGQHSHANVNQWSGFGPYNRRISAQALINEILAPFDSDEWCGYNHGAVTPGWKNAPNTSDVWVNNGDNAEMFVDLTVGEIKWHELGIVGVVFAIYDGATLVAYGSRNFNDASVTDDVTGLYATVLNCATQKTYTLKVWLVDATAYGFDDTQIVCRLPNTLDVTRTVMIKYASSWVYTDTNTMNLPSPWVQNGAAAMNWTTGVFNIGSIARITACNVRIKVRLINWLDQLVASGYIIGDASNYYSYDPMDGIDITGSVDLGNDLNWGYKVYVDFEYYL